MSDPESVVKEIETPSSDILLDANALYILLTTSTISRANQSAQASRSCEPPS
jgi:hypothetical protein